MSEFSLWIHLRKLEFARSKPRSKTPSLLFLSLEQPSKWEIPTPRHPPFFQKAYWPGNLYSTNLGPPSLCSVCSAMSLNFRLCSSLFSSCSIWWSSVATLPSSGWCARTVPCIHPCISSWAACLSWKSATPQMWCPWCFRTSLGPRSPYH